MPKWSRGIRRLVPTLGVMSVVGSFLLILYRAFGVLADTSLTVKAVHPQIENNI